MEKDYTFLADKTTWDEVQYYFQAVVMDCIKEDACMGYEAEEFSQRLYLYAGIFSRLDDKKDEFLAKQ